MCGIFGYIGPRNSKKVCLTGLKHLEYRGYDSAGIAGIAPDGQFLHWKEEGKIFNLENALPLSFDLDLAIAHTRWATHGKPSKDNAHPHFDENETVAVVHNGIIENHHALREMLKIEGVKFRSETDSEVVAQLIAHFYEGNLLGAVQKTLDLLQGFWGLAVIHKKHPDQIIAAARENPLAVGFNTTRAEAVISSDVNAFHLPDLDVLYLQNDEVAVVTAKGVSVYGQAFEQIHKSTEKIDCEIHELSKGDHEHYMLKEILEQPQTIQQAFHNRFIEDFGTAEFENLGFSSQELLSVERILILACGTSYHAGCVAASLLEDIARIPTQAEIASEFRYKNPIMSKNTLVIAISQSGETLDTIAAVREVKSKGAKVLALCNVRNSTLTREADSTLFLRAGPEISVCSTKAFTSQLAVLLLFTLLMARLRHMGKEEGQLFLSELRQLPEIVQKIIDKKDEIAALAEKYAKYDDIFFLGRHYMYHSSLESALKLKEISYINAIGLPAGEMKHGPIALVNEDLGVIGLCGNKKTYEKILGNLTEVKARGGPVLAFAPENAPRVATIADDVLYLPEISDELACIPYCVAGQLFAYYIAKFRGCPIDKPRNLAKSVTVE